MRSLVRGLRTASFLGLWVLAGCAGQGNNASGERPQAVLDAGSSNTPQDSGARAAGSSATPGGQGGTSASTAGTGGASGTGGAGGRAGSAATPRDAGAAGTAGGAGSTVMHTDAAVVSDAGSGERPLSSDRDAFFGDSRCATAGVRLCEDFEGRNAGDGPDPARWSVFGTPPKVDDARAARGQHSLHVHTDGNGASLIRETATFPAADNVLYGRMFVWFSALPTAPQWAHWTIVAGTGSGNDSEIRIGGQWDGNRNRWGTGTDHGPTGDWTRLDEGGNGVAAEPPLQQWLCVEWLYDGKADELRFYLDGVEHPSVHATSSDHGGSAGAFTLPEFDELGVGWWLYQGNPTPSQYDVWLDEIAIDDQRIGCVI